eukprot:scaffold107625_cov38-Cyclotella_meneghiniana.AAC.1
MAMKILAKMLNNLFQCKPSLFPLVLIKLVRLTIDHGVSPMSAIGLAYYGSMIANLGDLRGGHRFTKLSKALVNKHQFNQIAGEVLWITSDTLTYLEPIQGIQEYRREGRQMALAGGDIQSACFNAMLMVTDQLWSGVPLTQVKESISSAQQEMKCSTEKYFEIALSSCCLQAGHAVQTFFLGLASYRIYRETREELWAQRGKKLRERIQTWNEQGSKWNFQHKLELMEAEEAYSNGNFERAQILYDKAVSSAKQYKFIHEAALANELAAKFHLAKGARS